MFGGISDEDWTEREDVAEMLRASVQEVYGSRIRQKMREIRDHLESNGMSVSGLAFRHDDDPVWSFNVEDRTKDWELADITLTIVAAWTTDDAEATGYGINFMLNVCSFEGKTLGGMVPHNFTERCWVNLLDVKAASRVWRRWRDFDNGCDGCSVEAMLA